jgi:hypothetical protein
VSDSVVPGAYDRRLAEFRDGYEWEETDAIIRSFVHVGDLLETAFDPVTAARGMYALALVVRTPPHRPMTWTNLLSEAPEDWAETWREMDGYNDTSWSMLMETTHNLHAFAYFGVLPRQALSEASREDVSFDDVPSYIRSITARLQRFVQMLPKTVDVDGIDLIERACLAAEARLKIDADEPVTVHELAALSQVTTKRLQNAMYAKSSDAPIAGNDGLISSMSAMRWLEARDYRPSLWNDPEAEFAQAETTEDDLEDDFVFVPEAKDGSIFSPIKCLRGGENGKPRYTVGPKHAEKDFESFDKALAALTRMKTARWRRPTENGIFSVVSAERWRRITRDELKSL